MIQKNYISFPLYPFVPLWFPWAVIHHQTDVDTVEDEINQLIQGLNLERQQQKILEGE